METATYHSSDSVHSGGLADRLRPRKASVTTADATCTPGSPTTDRSNGPALSEAVRDASVPTSQRDLAAASGTQVPDVCDASAKHVAAVWGPSAAHHVGAMPGYHMAYSHDDMHAPAVSSLAPVAAAPCHMPAAPYHPAWQFAADPYGRTYPAVPPGAPYTMPLAKGAPAPVATHSQSTASSRAGAPFVTVPSDATATATAPYGVPSMPMHPHYYPMPWGEHAVYMLSPKPVPVPRYMYRGNWPSGYGYPWAPS